MIKVNDFNKAFVELKEIMKYFNDEIINKIPNDLKESIENVNENGYHFVYDNSIALYKQNILPETKALLSIIYSDYLCSQEEKEKWDEYDRYEKQLINKKIKKEKQEKYVYQDMFETKSNDTVSLIPQEKSEIITDNNQKWYQKIFENIRALLKKITSFMKKA